MILRRRGHGLGPQAFPSTGVGCISEEEIMLRRLGNVLFGLSILIAIGWTWGIIQNSAMHPHPDNPPVVGAVLIIVVPSLLIGWALRYILSGTTPEKKKVGG